MNLRLKRLVVKTICHKFPNFRCQPTQDSGIVEIFPIKVKMSNEKFKRLNLIIPSINEEHVFGGITTAITLFEELLKKLPREFYARVIITDATIVNPINRFKEYSFLSMSDESNSKLQVVSCNNRKNKRLSIVESDIFLATAWWTAHIAKQLLIEQQNNFLFSYPLIYLIQDFEPCFYNWSARYALADATYENEDRTIAIFNSIELKDYMNNNNYIFLKEYYFLPKMNDKLKNIWMQENVNNKKKQLIVYGRPSVDRNLFPILVMALKIWVKNQPDIMDWTLLSLGEKHEDINLGRGIILNSKGKLSLENYAKVLLESALGVSLMLSPHPSYPPLEMAFFGILTVTNNYANKNLSRMHKNLFTVESCKPSEIADRLLIVAKSLEMNKDKKIGILDKSFIETRQEFDFLNSLVGDLLNE